MFGPQTYTTRRDAINHEIIHPLAEYAVEHDVEAIADEILEYSNHQYKLKDDVTAERFWEVVKKHATF